MFLTLLCLTLQTTIGSYRYLSLGPINKYNVEGNPIGNHLASPITLQYQFFRFFLNVCIWKLHNLGCMIVLRFTYMLKWR